MLRTAYCSNVHAGADLVETRSNLQNYAGRVKQIFSPSETMGVGLWLSSETSKELLANTSRTEIQNFQQLLADTGIDAFTFNGFPFGNFHQPVVKKDVYLPTWHQAARFEYTRDLIQLIQQFSTSRELSISTMPLTWGDPPAAKGYLAEAARHLREIAQICHRVEQETGRLIHVCIEPEPGCELQYSRDVVRFFEKYLLRADQEAVTRRHIRVCHDVCHAVVMCESQSDVLAAYKSAGILVGKVQISSAVVVDFDSISPSERSTAMSQLASFAEDRYLHQTTIQQSGGETQFFEDLPIALQTVSNPEQASGTWRIHFHVPVYLQNFGLLRASQAEIIECVKCCREFSEVNHFEVETYAWNVLPNELQQQDLAVGIAQEMQWFADLAAKHLS